jgi:hypothetical protein
MTRWAEGPLLGCLTLLLAVTGGCAVRGATDASAGGQPAIDADALALLPGSAAIVGSLDARTMFTSGALGASAESLVDTFVPLPADSGFLASRDLDRVVVGSYVAQEPDVAAVLTGRFDLSKIASVTVGRNGAPIAKGTYAGFATDTVGPVMIAPLTPGTVVAGTPRGVHAVLDRIQQSRVAHGHLERSLSPETLATLQTPGAQIGVVADFVAQPIAAAALGSVAVAWLKGLRMVRAIGNFDPPGMNLAGTMTYGDPQQAQSAAEGVRVADHWLSLLGPLLGGAKLQNFQVNANGNDLGCKVAVDASSLGALLGLAARFAARTP